MSAITAAIVSVLTSDDTLTALLATYNGEPAVFSTDPPPIDAALPYIVTAGDIVAAPYDSKTSRGRDMRRDVRCYTDANGSAVTVEDIAERVHALLHRQAIPVVGMTTVIADANPPVAGPAEDRAYGRIVSVRLVVEE